MVNQSAQGLASLGRNGDSMLVHMTPREVSGLQSLAMSQGGSLTINPHTGLPEASFLGGLFDFVAPIAAGFFGMNPWLAAGIMGGKSLVEEGDPLKAAFSAFGGYSGANMGVNLKDFTTPAIPAAVQNTAEGAITNIQNMDPSNLMQVDKLGAEKAFGDKAFNIASDTTPYNRIGSSSTGINLNSQPINNAITNTGYGANIEAPNFAGNANELYAGAPGAPGVRGIGSSSFTSAPEVQIPDAIQPTSAFDQFGGAVTNAARNPIDFAKQVGEGSALKGAAKIGMYAASPFTEDITNMLAPQPLTYYEDPDKDKWTGPEGQLNLSNKYSTGLRLLPNLNQPITAKEGGIINAYAQGGTIQTGGVRDLYGSNDDQVNTNLSQDGYGIGRLNALASQESMNNAKILGYAAGGETHLNLKNLPSLNLNTVNKPVEDTQSVNPVRASVGLPRTMGPSAGVGIGNNIMLNRQNERLAVVAPPPVPKSYALNLITGLQTPQYAHGGYLDGQGDGMNAPRGFAEGGETHLNLKNLPSLNVNTGEQIPAGSMSSGEAKLNNFINMMTSPTLPNFKGRPSVNNPLYYLGELAKNRSQLAKGGYLDGQGDGMSDSIPATIEGKQPARLADGEFVVPADVVSHLGNGSSKAGSKRLYAMLDKVRKARTGHTKQGKQINPNRYMPA